MNFLELLLALSIMTAIFGFYCATKKIDNTKDLQAKGRKRFRPPRLHFVNPTQFADLYESERHHVLFRFQDPQTVNEDGETSPQRIGITLRELEKCIPWVPGDSGVFICSSERFSPSLLRQLEAIRTQRDLFLIDNLPTIWDQSGWWCHDASESNHSEQLQREVHTP
jgi:hypothetical protein